VKRRLRHWHRWLGLALLAPLFVWIATGVVFLVRPGYAAAYADLHVAERPLAQAAGPAPRPGWLEIRRLRTVLGRHLLVRTQHDGWQQFDPDTLARRPAPGPATIRRLVAAAIDGRKRYGHIVDVDGSTVTTSTGVRIDVDWSRLRLDQRGRDTRWIDWAYDMHRLQWTGIGGIDRTLGGVVLLLLAASAGIGARLVLRPRR